MKNNQDTKECRYRDKKCTFSDKDGYLEKACIKKHGKNHLFQNKHENAKSKEKKFHHLKHGVVRIAMTVVLKTIFIQSSKKIMFIHAIKS